jgi:hypothetical protein
MILTYVMTAYVVILDYLAGFDTLKPLVRWFVNSTMNAVAWWYNEPRMRFDYVDIEQEKIDAEKAWCQTCMTIALFCECSTWPDYLKDASIRQRK